MDIIKSKVKEITNGLSNDEAIKRVFEYVRDMPYYLVPFSDALHALKYCFGDCRSKHNLLSKMFSIMNIPHKHLHMEFDWKDVPLPKEVLMKLGSISSVWPHYSLKAFIDNKWRVVDVTWDSPLARAGFHINEWEQDMQFITNNVTDVREENKFHDYVNRLFSLLKVVRNVDDYFVFGEYLNSYLRSIRKKKKRKKR